MILADCDLLLDGDSAGDLLLDGDSAGDLLSGGFSIMGLTEGLNAFIESPCVCFLVNFSTGNVSKILFFLHIQIFFQ